MTAGTFVVGTKLSVAGAAGNSLFHRPCNCLSIVAVRRDIGEVAHALGLRRTGRTPKECDDLCTGADAVVWHSDFEEPLVAASGGKSTIQPIIL